MRRRWFAVLTMLAFVLALAIGVLLWQSVQTSSVVVIQTRIEAMRPLFTTIRFLVIALMALLWPALTQALHRWGHVDEAGAVRLLSLRWRMVIWLLVIELMLGQNLPGRFLDLLPGVNR
ncbi:MAG: hypothetical protein U1B30_11820 [Pseudomonadota bacterium]|nr:hypothetical protein [Pseudomonadota bacterium]